MKEKRKRKRKSDPLAGPDDLPSGSRKIGSN